MDFEPCFKVSNLVSVHPKIAKLSQMFIDLNGLSISWKKKLALAPCAIPETPILIPRARAPFGIAASGDGGWELINGVRA